MLILAWIKKSTALFPIKQHVVRFNPESIKLLTMKKDEKTFLASVISPIEAIFCPFLDGKECPENNNTGYRQLIINLLNITSDHLRK